MSLRYYAVEWSEEDQEYVATCSDYPSLSWLAKTEADALEGLLLMVSKIDLEMKEQKQ